MGENDKSCQEGSVPDIPHLIRSIQRIKGNPDCFGMIAVDCRPSACCWYDLCLKISVKASALPPPNPSKKKS